jgi:N-acetylglucosaminyldiphosphoundecaprenol N-acetyl-beta-D-mannosaminyltransferase
VLGIRVDGVTRAWALERIGGWIEQRRATPERPARQVITLNPEMVMAARADATLRQAIERAALVVPDGIGVVWAARWLGWRVPERVTGIDLLVALAELAAARGWRIFLLGGAPGVAEAAARQLRAACPALLVAGTYAGTPALADDAPLAARVRASGADLVAVAYGVPAQERWIARNRTQLGAGVAIGVGGAFDLLAGRVPRAPRWLRRAGLEWAYRLWREPWRWRRMLALPRFAGAVLLARWGPSTRAAPRN